jgi:hypothetical protein
MEISLLTSIFGIGNKLIEKFFPDPVERQKAQLQLLQLQQEGAFREEENRLKRDLAQIELNKVEAGSSGVFKGGWRPGAGWVCVSGLAYNYMCQPLLAWYSLAHNIPTPPILQVDDLLLLLGGLLGLGGLRTTEKLKKVTA